MIKLNQDSNNFNQSNFNEQNNNNFNYTSNPINTSETNNNNNNLTNINNIMQTETQNISSTDSNNDLNSYKPKNKNILKKICIILSIIVGILGFGIGIYSMITSFNMESPEFFGPLLNIFVFLGGIAFFINTGIVIATIWIIYAIIQKIGKSYKELNSNKKKRLKIVLIIIIALLLIAFKYNYSNKNLAEVLKKPPSYEYYNDSSYYFIYKDKIYYYTLDQNNIYTKLHDRLFVMNLDGTNNKKLAETDELRYAYFYFVYNDEAYYYTMYYNENKKINLKTGEIKTLETKDNYLDKTLNNGTIYSFIDNAIGGNAYSIFKKIDIKNNNTISEIKTKHSMAGNIYYFDYDGGNIYYLENYYSKFPSIYKNNQIIYEFTEYNRDNFPKIEFIAVNNNFIYFKQNTIIYKLNLNNKFIEKEISNNLNDFKRISSGNNTDNYFYSNKNIYSFDMENDTFELIIKNIEKQPEYIYNTNNKLIFTENTDNIDIDNLGSVIIYNKLNNDTEKFDNIRKVSFDEEYMYLLYQSNNNYSVKKINLYS